MALEFYGELKIGNEIHIIIFELENLQIQQIYSEAEKEALSFIINELKENNQLVMGNKKVHIEASVLCEELNWYYEWNFTIGVNAWSYHHNPNPLWKRCLRTVSKPGALLYQACENKNSYIEAKLEKKFCDENGVSDSETQSEKKRILKNLEKILVQATKETINE